MKRLITPENNIGLAIEVRRGQWLVHNIDLLIPTAISILDKQDFIFQTSVRDIHIANYDMDARDITDESKKKEDKCVAVIPISGTITKYDTCGTIGTTTYAKAILEATSDSRVVAIVLDIDSGGGSASAVPILIDAIERCKASGKTIIAHADFCASAAYWIAAHCDTIYCDNHITSDVGSIGAYSYFINDRGALEKEGYNVVEVYADESKDKNLAYREAIAGKYDLVKEKLSHIVGAFHQDVKNGRPTLKANADGVLSGAMFFADTALDVGLIDGVATLQECVDIAFIRANFHTLK